MKRISFLILTLLALVYCAGPKSGSKEVLKEFHEGIPGWNMAEAAVTGIIINPERPEKGEAVIIQATISNLGTGTTSPLVIHFLVDNEEIGQQRSESLGPHSQAQVSIRWQAKESGRHRIEVSLSVDPEVFDGSFANNSLTEIVRVAGEQRPVPELEVDIPESALQEWQTANEESLVPVIFRNPSFAPIESFWVQVYLDGEPIGRKKQIAYLAPGGEHRIPLQLQAQEPGEHRLSIALDLPDNYPKQNVQKIKGWSLVIPQHTSLNNIVQKHKWMSIGPNKIDNGNVGRIVCFAYHPINHNIMYAGGFGRDCNIPAGTGIWKTTDSGKNWVPIGDKLPSMMVSSIAIDPFEPANIYAGTVNNGIFKSTDEGKTWNLFAGPQVTGHFVSKLILCTEARSIGPRVVLYAASNIGVLRYKSDDPGTKKSRLVEWENIKQGIVTDLVRHPSDRSFLYASIEDKGLFRIKNAVEAKPEITFGNHDWEQLNTKQNNGLPSISGWNKLKLDIFSANPQYVYAGVLNPKPGYCFALYRSKNSGDTFQLLVEYPNDVLGGIYNPFIRVHPTMPDMIYFGGVHLYKWSAYDPPLGKTSWTYLIETWRADMKELIFNPVTPTNPNASLEYFLACDQGMFLCKAEPKPANYSFKKSLYFGLSSDSFEPRNNNLSVTQIYDFDISSNLPIRILAGTQDDGTILYEGNDIWKQVPGGGGDGYYSLIAPSNSKVMYAQHQDLFSTVRSGDGGKTWSAIAKNKGLPLGYVGDGYIIVDPNYPNLVLAAGASDEKNKDGQVFIATNTDLGENCIWEPRGPKGVAVKGWVKRIVIQPGTTAWFAGTTKGQVWTTSSKIPGSWSNIDSHPGEASIESMAFSPANPNVLFVLYSGGSPYHRIQRLVYTTDGGWNGTPITDNLDLEKAGFLRVICGDYHHSDVAYVGTDHGVFRWDGAQPSYDSWKGYNDGFPLTTVVDLKVGPDGRLYAATKGRGAWMVITGQ
ncbi:MAG: hypothetical protein JNK77_11965 [Saprospiraceae bacterium]|nr:hypothetical protein [Saprospiraceae bacterium]